ncbi:SDR family NAD(P)-dependent oxidoreductase [Cellulomonas wangsupingiae]|uniref:SDR family oxidoreductase n=1 Tax=Cellulomonas wangsupingiae TaxID=2968085 RepID=A0ABY5K2J0_9CELL|nr:SDR family oxidoreductase [Cellulomonas wangsupingiae]MCC2336221.1 SDR family oxidoreductase [Cellulomonas wangsupingiae]UUI64535.1 SDR family oxidoreductase [Cellulomonas wangsupingiae]
MSDATPLLGRTALVTGGGTGIGREVALALGRAGADVAVTYRTHDAAEVVAELRALGRTAEAFALDATDPQAVREVVAAAAQALGGRLDVLVNNAGGLVGRVPLAEMSAEHWHTVLDVNLTSAFLVTQAVLEVMPAGGRVVQVSSAAGQDGGGAGASAYAAAKAGMDGLTRALAKELGPRGITVNSVAPGFIGDTPFHARFTPETGQRAAVAGTLVGRAGTPQDVAAAVVYLASEPGFVTGAVLDLNGGGHLR